LGNWVDKPRNEDGLWAANNSVVIVWNPIAGRRPSRKLAEELRNRLLQEGLKVYLFDDIWQASAAAEDLFSEGKLRAFAAVGGDGTFALQVNLTSLGMPLALLPAGTGNVLAKSIGLPKSPKKIAKAILTGKKTQLDAGEANGKIFVNMISLGFDALVVSKVHKVRTQNRKAGNIGYRSYLLPILESCREYCFPELQVEMHRSFAAACSGLGVSDSRPKDSERFRGEGGASGQQSVEGFGSGTLSEGTGSGQEVFRAKWVFVCNTPRYGWGVRIAPGANPRDGRLDCWMFRRGSIKSGLWYALAVQLGGLHRLLPGCQHLQGTRFFITSEVPVPWQLDGDPAGVSPVEVKVLPGRITLFVP
jgi:diacylglycerol kinase family enzyme